MKTQEKTQRFHVLAALAVLFIALTGIRLSQEPEKPKPETPVAPYIDMVMIKANTDSSGSGEPGFTTDTVGLRLEIEDYNDLPEDTIAAFVVPGYMVDISSHKGRPSVDSRVLLPDGYKGLSFGKPPSHAISSGLTVLMVNMVNGKTGFYGFLVMDPNNEKIPGKYFIHAKNREYFIRSVMTIAPCDYDGPELIRAAHTNAEDLLEFKKECDEALEEANTGEGKSL